MRLLPTLLALLPLTLAVHAGSPAFTESLEGWKFDNAKHWTVKDGVLTCSNDGGDGDILFTQKDDYTDFEVTVDFKFESGTIDSGIFLRDGKEQIQIGESGSLKKDMTALPYIPGKSYPIKVDTAEKVMKWKDWNTIKVRVTGNTYTTWLNGTEIMTYTSDTIAPKGPIGIQVHPKREMKMHYRNLTITDLSHS
ncbi:MAG: DUF1080 domain-containing protein [Verrucomicrobiales bacterium]|nr:DUF1080 domain-containing protein [Verrucomicrobiales bacterium]